MRSWFVLPYLVAIKNKEISLSMCTLFFFFKGQWDSSYQYYKREFATAMRTKSQPEIPYIVNP